LEAGRKREVGSQEGRQKEDSHLIFFFRDFSGHLASGYTLQYLQHPLPNLLKSIEQLKEECGFYNEITWEGRRAEYRQRLLVRFYCPGFFFLVSFFCGAFFVFFPLLGNPWAVFLILVWAIANPYLI
jgi:hypothetical protein